MVPPTRWPRCASLPRRPRCAARNLHAGARLAYTPAPPTFAPAPALGPTTSEQEERAGILLAAAVAEAFGDTLPVPIVETLVNAPPAEALREVAEDADLLVVGARGHTGFLGQSSARLRSRWSSTHRARSSSCRPPGRRTPRSSSRRPPRPDVTADPAGCRRGSSSGPRRGRRAVARPALSQLVAPAERSEPYADQTGDRAGHQIGEDDLRVAAAAGEHGDPVVHRHLPGAVGLAVVVEDPLQLRRDVVVAAREHAQDVAPRHDAHDPVAVDDGDRLEAVLDQLPARGRPCRRRPTPRRRRGT